MQSVSHTLHRGPMDNLASNAMRSVLTGVGFDNNGARLVLCYQTTLWATAVSICVACRVASEYRDTYTSSAPANPDMHIVM